ncbi:MAG: rhodanese-like domain-containing protein [Desulfobacterales bacterium]
MNWKNLFTPVKNMDSNEAKKYMDTHSSNSYQLLDVRQPDEYEKEHIPGSSLIPLPNLSDRLSELDSEKPTLVYCAVGGRSRAASQLISGKGFNEVYNLAGGIKAWNNPKATGPVEEGLELVGDLFTGKEEYSDAFHLAYAMEKGLRLFYFGLADKEQDESHKQLFNRLAGFENKHMLRLVEEYQADTGNKSDSNIEDFATGNMPEGVMEGGSVTKFLQKADPGFDRLSSIIDFAMSLEAQALDLYSRLAKNSDKIRVHDFFLRLADEEKTHLNYLAKERSDIKSD